MINYLTWSVDSTQVILNHKEVQENYFIRQNGMPVEKNVVLRVKLHAIFPKSTIMELI
jgi:hypothetical protein